jgi:hypothetical protein
MLTANAISPDTLISSIDKGAIAYLPRERLLHDEKVLGKGI